MFVCTNENAKSKKLPCSGFEPKTSCRTSQRLNRYASSVVVISNIVTVCVYCCTCRLVTNVRRGTRRATRAGHDVACMGLQGHLDSLGPDSEVLARVLASTSRLHAGSFEVARRTGSDAGLQPVTVENHLQAATGHWGHGWPVEGGHSESTGTEIVIVAISALAESDCRASKQSTFGGRLKF